MPKNMPFPYRHPIYLKSGAQLLASGKLDTKVALRILDEAELYSKLSEAQILGLGKSNEQVAIKIFETEALRDKLDDEQRFTLSKLSPDTMRAYLEYFYLNRYYETAYAIEVLDTPALCIKLEGEHFLNLCKNIPEAAAALHLFSKPDFYSKLSGEQVLALGRSSTTVALKLLETQSLYETLTGEQLIALGESARATMRQLIELVKTDPAVTIKLLSLAKTGPKIAGILPDLASLDPEVVYKILDQKALYAQLDGDQLCQFLSVEGIRDRLTAASLRALASFHPAVTAACIGDADTQRRLVADYLHLPEAEREHAVSLGACLLEKADLSAEEIVGFGQRHGSHLEMILKTPALLQPLSESQLLTLVGEETALCLALLAQAVARAKCSGPTLLGWAETMALREAVLGYEDIHPRLIEAHLCACLHRINRGQGVADSALRLSEQLILSKALTASERITIALTDPRMARFLLAHEAQIQPLTGDELVQLAQDAEVAHTILNQYTDRLLAVQDGTPEQQRCLRSRRLTQLVCRHPAGADTLLNQPRLWAALTAQDQAWMRRLCLTTEPPGWQPPLREMGQILSQLVDFSRAKQALAEVRVALSCA